MLFKEFKLQLFLQPASVAIVACFVVGYLGLVQLRRWQHYHRVHAKYQKKYEDGELTPDEAQKVMELSATYDMPVVVYIGVVVGAIQVYCIPSISKLLVSTKQLGNIENVGRRYADMEILIDTFLYCPLSGFRDISQRVDKDPPAEDPRANISIARVNFLHSRYKIANDDYLWTLYCSIIGPIDSVNLYGWRNLSPMERDSRFIVWAEVARRMGIKDLPASLDDLIAWANAYEEERIVPSKANYIVTKNTIDDAVVSIPRILGLRSLVEGVFICLLGDRIRGAMMLPAQPWYIHAFVKLVMFITTFSQRWLLLPRSQPDYPTIHVNIPQQSFSKRAHTTASRFKPWYKPESTGFQNVIDRLHVKMGFTETVPSKQYKSEGYRLEELGPVQFEKLGQEDVFKDAERIQGCPIPSYYWHRE
ncbi:hypothetical protein FA15DRAFT_668053 [Coprinopsis marcescibilis]|uniref:ER-bound oxygenase mpaB/mpaB'/Rubber oxygenase catalytic domain-containing protein n=1 Tax=Coprinopsis marcescibilis TaxID=230819 RepID=A0A5C3KZZ9_COPMA|nr:hypothetical protein FA15DRAFT_668053 [Coprinopsis marcescibilis]